LTICAQRLAEQEEAPPLELAENAWMWQWTSLREGYRRIDDNSGGAWAARTLQTVREVFSVLLQ